jgi:hypothetical protein
MKEVFYHPLELQEAKSRMELLIHGNRQIEIWNGTNLFQSEIKSYSLKSNVVEIKISQVDLSSSTKDIICAFKVTAFNYIFRARITDQETLELSSPVYRSDRRKDERILLQPAYKAFAHLNLQQNNVIYLIKGNKIDEDQLDLPLIDISSGAVSFKASQEQSDFFETKESLTELKITIDGKGFMLRDLHKLYSVPSIDRRFPGRAVYKIGYSFASCDESLKDFIEARKSGSFNSEYFEDFSQFLSLDRKES